jgi:hypothetical protein
MGRSARFALLFLSLFTSDAFAAAGRGNAGVTSVHFLVAGFSSIVHPIAALFRSPAAPRLHAPLTCDQGWTEQRFAIDDWGTGLYLRVRGRVAFGRAEITLDDGEVRSIDLAEALRADGDFELADFGTERDVRSLRIRLRADGGDADVAVLLGR